MSYTLDAALADIARRHELVLLADEIYEKILYDGATHHHAALAAGDDVVVAVFPRAMPVAEVARRLRDQLDG